jgi:hypothetical protein
MPKSARSALCQRLVGKTDVSIEDDKERKQMSTTNQLGSPEMRQALADLRSSTAASLRAFNGTVPYACRLRRSEMDRFTMDLLWAAETAPQRRWPSFFGRIVNTASWIRRARAAAQLS